MAKDKAPNPDRQWQERVIAERETIRARVGMARVAAAQAYQEGKSADDVIWQLMRDIEEGTRSLRTRWKIL